MRVGGHFLEQYIQNNFRLLLVTLALFIIGTVTGSFYAASLAADAQEALYGVFGGAQGLFAAQDSFRVFTAAFINFFQLWILLSLCGMCSLGIPLAPLLVGLRGFVCSFCVAVLVLLYGYKGLAAAAAGLLPQMLLLLPAMQMLCVGAVNQARAAANTTDRALRRSRFLSYCLFCLILLAGFALAALYEGYAGWVFILKLLG